MHRWCGPLRGRANPRRRRAGKCERSQYSRTCSRRRPSRSKRPSGNGSRSSPAEAAKPRGAPSRIRWTRQATQKEQVMSFEEMAESAKSAGPAGRIQVRRKPRARRHERRRAMVRRQGRVRYSRTSTNPSKAVGRLDDDENGVVLLILSDLGQRELLTVNEFGLYSLIFRAGSRGQALKWVTSTVLPRFPRPEGTRTRRLIGLLDDEVDYERWLLGARFWTPRSSPSKCSVSASISSSR